MVTMTFPTPAMACIADVPADVAALRSRMEGATAWVPVDAMGIREDLFQFRRATRGTFPVWIPEEVGTLDAWEDRHGDIGPAGAVYVVNGHHRYLEGLRHNGLAIERGLPPVVYEFRVRFLTCATWQEAREQGALANLRNSPEIDAVDVAHYLRSRVGTGPSDAKAARAFLVSQGVRIHGRVAISDGLLLATLPEVAFAHLYEHADAEPRLPRIASAVAEHFAPRDMAGQYASITAEVMGGRRVSAEEIAQRAEILRQKRAQLAQGGLVFDMGDEATRAEVVAAIVRHFAGLIRAGKRLSSANAKAFYAVTDEQAGLAELAAQVGEVIERTAHQCGPLGERVTQAVNAVTQGADAGDVMAALVAELETGDIITLSLYDSEIDTEPLCYDPDADLGVGIADLLCDLADVAAPDAPVPAVAVSEDAPKVANSGNVPEVVNVPEVTLSAEEECGRLFVVWYGAALLAGRPALPPCRL